MNNRFCLARQLATCVALLIAAHFLAGCASVPKDDVDDLTDSPAARALLAASADAHGKAAFDQLRDVSVSYDGEWLNNVSRLQPVLVDERYRKASQERILPSDGIIAQTHVGPGGTKYVLRESEGIKVWYDGKESGDAEVLDAAAAVVDAYAVFLMAPFVLLDQAKFVGDMPGTKVNGHPCDQVLVVLRPGLGRSEEDRVIAAIDRQTKLVRRVRFTFNGLDTTRGVVADVILSDWRDVAGVKWPTRFFETVRRPVSVDAHRWRLTGIDVNRGLSPADLTGGSFNEKAAAPAASLE